MSNCVFGFPIYSDVNSVYTPSFSGGSWSGSLPLTNLQDRRLAKVARSTNATLANTKFDIDLQLARAVGIIAIPKHNLSLTAQVKVRAHSSAIGSDTYINYNPLDKDAGITLSGGNLTQTGSGATDMSVRSGGGKTTGKWYWEVTVVTPGDLIVGIANGSHVIGDYPGKTANSWGYYVGGQKVTASSFTAYGSSYTTGDKIGVALDLDAGKVWFSKNGVWQGSGDPAAGTNAAFTGITGTIYPCDGQAAANASSTANYGGSVQAYAAPAGFNVGNFVAATTSYDSGMQSVYNSAAALTAEDVAEMRVQGFNPGFVHVPSALQNYQYWRIEIFDSSNTAGYVELGRLVIAGKWQPSINMAYGAKLGWDTSSTRNETDGGAAIYNEKSNRRTATFAVDHLPENEAFINAFNMGRKLGITKQLMFVFNPADTALMHLRSFLCVQKEHSPIDFPYALYNAANFSLIEEL